MRSADCGVRNEASDFAICTSPAAILFDAVGTLIVPDPPVARAYHAAGQRHGSKLSEESIRWRFRSAFARQEAFDRSTGYRTSEAHEQQRWRTIIAEIFDDLSDTEPLFESLWQYFALPAHWKVADDAARCFDELSRDGFVLGMASNFDDRLQAICQAHEALAPLTLFVSSRIGYKKPALEFFRAIEASLGIAPERLLLVGDDLENDFQAARRAGWQALLLDPSSTPAAGSSRGAAVELPTLRALGELPTLLKAPSFAAGTRKFA